MVDIVRSLVGTPPAGYEVIEYVLAAAIAVMMIREVVGLFWLVANVFVRSKGGF